MSRLFRPALLLLAALLALPAVVSVEASVNPLAEANNAFAFRLFAETGRGENTFISPLSISSALALTMQGAQGQTKTDMATVLGLTTVSPLDYGRFIRGIASADSGGRLDLANGLWAAAGEKLKADFVRLASSTFDASVDNVDFSGNPSKAVETINGWVSSRTSRRIPSLLTRVDASTRLILTNAVYFKGSWLQRFDATQTVPAPFHAPGGRSVRVPMMRQKATFQVFNGENARMVVLPYAGPLDMYIVLPNDDLATVEAMLGASFKSWRQMLEPATVEVRIPRFSSSSRVELEKTLRALGMGRAFSEGADFSAMLVGGRCAIDSVVHQAVVEVNEAGSEASAGSAVMVTRGNEEPFVADRPFVYMIVDRRTHAVLFLGRLVEPQA